MNQPESVPVPAGTPAPAEVASPGEPSPAPAINAAPGLEHLAMGVGVIWAFDIFIGIVLFAATWGNFQKHPWLLVGSTVLSNVCALVVAWYIVCKRYDRPFREGFALRPVSRRTFTTSIAIGVAAALAATLLILQFGTGQSFMAEFASTREGLAAIAVVLLFVPPFEEVYYRGFIFPILRRRVGAVGAVLLVTGWFTLAHSFQLAGEWIALPVIAFMGAVFTLQRQLTRSLIPPILTHFTYNTVLLLISLAG